MYVDNSYQVGPFPLLLAAPYSLLQPCILVRNVHSFSRIACLLAFAFFSRPGIPTQFTPPRGVGGGRLNSAQQSHNTASTLVTLEHIQCRAGSLCLPRHQCPDGDLRPDPAQGCCFHRTAQGLPGRQSRENCGTECGFIF